MRKAPKHSAGIFALAVGKSDPKSLQDFLSLKFALSRRTAKAMIDGRNVWVNRKCVWIARYSLKTGEQVEVPQSVARAAQRQARQAEQGDDRHLGSSPSRPPRRHVRVLWQDGHYLVCDKPSGLLSCGDPGSVESILREQEGIPTLEAVHRLDRDTTGCLMFAKRHDAFEAAVEMFKTHRVTKVYHAVVVGAFKFPRRIVDSPLDGQDAVSRITREASSSEASFLRVCIDTGRTNQIRRHLAQIRFPVVGDRVFGRKNAHDPRLMRIPRQMLHASTLAMPNPLVKRDEIKVHSPLPADFREALRLFGMGNK